MPGPPRTSIRRLCAALVLGSALAPIRLPAQDAAALAGRSDRALAGLHALEAAFLQRVENPILEQTTTGHGRLSYRAPDRFRIAYTNPAGDLIVHDGARVWIYLPSSQPGQVIRQPAEAAGVRNPLTFLRDLRDAYQVAHGGRETVAGRAAERLVLEPRGSDAPYAGLEVWIDRADGLPRQVRTRTAQGVVTTYTFTDLVVDPRLEENRFRFSVPRGVEVFEP